MSFDQEQAYPGEKDGFTNHEARLSADVTFDAIPPELKQVTNRIVVIAPDLETVKQLQARLPAFLQELEPMSFSEAVAQDIRPEPGRLLHITREEVNTLRNNHRGKMFFHAYSVFEYVEGYKGWTDFRDHGCKWGRNPVRHAPGNTLSFQVLNGQTTIEQVKQNCGFQ